VLGTQGKTVGGNCTGQQVKKTLKKKQDNESGLDQLTVTNHEISIVKNQLN